MALDKITSTMITDEAVTTAKLGPSAVTGAKIAADAIDITDLGTIMSVGETAPSGPFIGQRWYRASTAITYQYTNDGTSSFWLDVSSGGIGTSTERGVDFVGDIDPHKATNLGVVGSVYYNRESNRHFICTTATSGSQVWSGRYNAAGGTVTDYLLSSVYYRVHTFLASGTFVVEDTTTCDFLVVAGGGSSGGDGSSGAGAGGVRSSISSTGGGGSVESALSITSGTHIITVGDGGTGVGGDIHGIKGGASSIGALKSCVGGGGSPFAWGNRDQSTMNGGSGAGAHGEDNTNTMTGGVPTSGEGYVGGAATDGHDSGGGGGGAGGAGQAGQSNTHGGDGGAGITNTIRDGSTAAQYGGGGGGGAVAGTATTASHGGGAGAGSGSGGDATANTGGGGGGSANGSGGGVGGSGIVVIRYALS